MTEVSSSGWLRTDERGDVLTSLSACLVCLKHCEKDPGLWKWAILSLHSAFQGAMVCHLSGTAQLGALTNQSARKWLDWYERDRKGEIRRIDCGTDDLGIPRFRFAEGHGPPPERLADARELFARLANGDKRIEGGVGAVINVTASEWASFQRLHGLRNEFAHFTPKGWSVELAGLPGIFLDVLGVIEKIAGDPWPFRHTDVTELTKRDELIQQLQEELKAIKPWTEREPT